MATKPKFEKDAERMGSRSFGGYAADRALKRHDFAKAGEVARKSPLHPAERPGLAPDVKREVETYAKGGLVGGSAPKSTPYKMSGGRKAKPC